ncbi:MAG: hypothetical protein ACYSYW_11795, partial [Planctomycetota bacterium]
LSQSEGDKLFEEIGSTSFATVLASPKIMVLDGDSAAVNIGDRDHFMRFKVIPELLENEAVTLTIDYDDEKSFFLSINQDDPEKIKLITAATTKVKLKQSDYLVIQSDYLVIPIAHIGIDAAFLMVKAKEAEKENSSTSPGLNI